MRRGRFYNLCTLINGTYSFIMVRAPQFAIALVELGLGNPGILLWLFISFAVNWFVGCNELVLP